MRILSKLNAMSLGKKIYAGLWAVTGGLLIALIVMFVGMNKTYGETNPPKDGWTIKTINAAEGVTYGPIADEPVSLTVTPTEDVKDIDGKVVVAKGTTPANLKFADVKKVEAFNKYFAFKTYDTDKDTTTAAVALYALDKWDAQPTDKAKTAINATATVGGLFGLALVGTVFTTVGVSVAEKRRGGRK